MSTNQKTTILNHLKRVGDISPLEALGLYRVMRLAAVVHALKKEGHKISTEIRIAPNGHNYARYRLAAK